MGRSPGIRSAGVLLLLMLLTITAGCGSGGQSPSAAGPSGRAATAAPQQSAAAPSAGQGAPALEQQYEQVVKQVLPSVVQITTDKAEGSGVVYDDHGSIVTNAHVVAGAKTIRVTPATGGGPVSATVLGSFDADDLAVLRVTGLTLQPARFGDSSALEVGQIVLAMGNPLGLTGSVTTGIISAMGRTVTTAREGAFPGATIANSIQTSAEINPGNSGGALVALTGEVIGIPAAGARDPRAGGAAPGIGFAIPANTVTKIAPQLIQGGRVTDSGRAALGVTVRTVIDPTSLQPSGAEVVAVEARGPAAKAGVRPGDVLLSVDGTPTLTQTALAEALASHAPGDQVSVQVRPPNGEDRTVQITLGKLPG